MNSDEGSENAAVDETACVEAAREGDERAFARLIERYEGGLFRFIMERIGNREDAEDVLQITFVAAYRNLGRYRSKYRFSTWLYTIANRRTIDYLRRRRGNTEEERDEPGPLESPAEALERNEEVGQLWRLARTVLSDRQHAVLWLRYGEDLDLSEIASITGLSRTHVKVLLHRARKALGRHMASETDARETTEGRKSESSDKLKWNRTLLMETL